MSKNRLHPSEEGEDKHDKCRIVHEQHCESINKMQPADRLSKEIESVSAAGDAAAMIMSEVRKWIR